MGNLEQIKNENINLKKSNLKIWWIIKKEALVMIQVVIVILYGMGMKIYATWLLML
jgi:hypothetical protein